jgi:hypothetical protein
MNERGRAGQRARASGWRQWTAERAQRELEDWRGSGRSLDAFARGRGYSAQRLRWWRNRLADWKGDGEQREPPRLVPVAVAAAIAGDAGATVRIRLPGGLQVDIEDVAAVSPEWLAAFARALGREAE